MKNMNGANYKESIYTQMASQPAPSRRFMMKKTEENLAAAGAVRQAMPSPTAPIKELESFSNVELKTNLHSQ